MIPVLDLFAGAVGGWSLGLHRAGFTTVAACEIDPWRRAAFARNFPEARLYDDVRTLSAARLHADGVVRPYVIAGSPPCQDASAANTSGRGVDGERTGLYREWLRLVSELRPAWTCVENSPRLRTRGVDRLLGELESLDYTVWPLVVSAGDVGAPHERERVWIVGADANRDRQHGCASDGEMAGMARRSRGDTACLGLVGGRSTEAAGLARPEPSGDAERHGADANGSGIRLESGRVSGADGPGAPEPSVDDPDAPGIGGRPGPIGAIAISDAGRRRRPQPLVGRGGVRANAAGAPLRQGEPGDPCAQLPPALRAWAAGWPRWNGGLAGLAAAYAAERSGQLADGAAARLARPAISDTAAERFASSERNRRIAAGGDAIVPQIAEAIGRAIRGMTSC